MEIRWRELRLWRGGLMRESITLTRGRVSVGSKRKLSSCLKDAAKSAARYSSSLSLSAVLWCVSSSVAAGRL